MFSLKTNTPMTRVTAIWYSLEIFWSWALACGLWLMVLVGWNTMGSIAVWSSVVWGVLGLMSWAASMGMASELHRRGISL